MLFVDNLNEHDASINLALEEYVLRNAQTDEDMLLFYINAPSIIIGRHQNTLEEINCDYVDEHGIRVVRRLSGGGAVYHDLGNLNYTFIMDVHDSSKLDLALFCEPVVKALQILGIQAEISGRNDITINGRKFSGNAQYRKDGRVMHHGTILFDSDL